VATLGLNPSRLEFLDRRGRELDGPRRRLETLRSLSVGQLSKAPEKAVRRVFDACCGYFQANPYRAWFDPLDQVLSGLDASYYDGSACHLDLIQWATDPTWRHLPDAGVRARLLARDGPFLLNQLTHERIHLLLLNGRTVISQLSRLADGVRLIEAGYLDGPASRVSRLYVGQLPGPIRVVGWSVNLQSSFGVSKEFRAELARSVSGLAKRGSLDPLA
jgi:hypothetical protein